jgi:hypothetical protein
MIREKREKAGKGMSRPREKRGYLFILFLLKLIFLGNAVPGVVLLKIVVLIYRVLVFRPIRFWEDEY